MPNNLLGFMGDYALLNPSYMEPVVYDGDTYPTIVAAVEASKFDRSGRMVFQHGSARVATQGFARPYTEVQLRVLTDLLEERFAPGTKFREVLDSTKGMPLVYNNEVHRNWYGSCSCARCQTVEHLNHVGKILERIRDGQ